MIHGNGQKVIHVNFYSAEVDEVYFPDHEVVGDIANAIWQLNEAVVPVRRRVPVAPGGSCGADGRAFASLILRIPRGTFPSF